MKGNRPAQAGASWAAGLAQRGLLRGLGIATFLEWTGGNALEETVAVTVQADGMIEVFTAVNAMGQGIATTLAQLVPSRLWELMQAPA